MRAVRSAGRPVFAFQLFNNTEVLEGLIRQARIDFPYPVAGSGWAVVDAVPNATAFFLQRHNTDHHKNRPAFSLITAFRHASSALNSMDGIIGSQFIPCFLQQGLTKRYFRWRRRCRTAT